MYQKSRRREEALQLPSLAAEESLATPARGEVQGMHFKWELGGEKSVEAKTFNIEDGRDSKRINEKSGLETCEHMLALLETPAKWRDIRKTLHWLEKVLASNKTTPKLCPRKKTDKGFTETLEKFPKEKKKPNNLTVSWRRYAINSPKSNIYSGRSRKSRKDGKHKSRRNRTKKGNKDKKFGHFGGRESNQPFNPHTAILKPNSVLSRGRGMILGKETRKCRILQSGYKRVKIDVNCLNDVQPEKSLQEKPQEVPPKPKGKPWPHFVYHRVSSSFLHPDSTGRNHRQSAYVAISVATSAKPEAADNKTK